MSGASGKHSFLSFKNTTFETLSGMALSKYLPVGMETRKLNQKKEL
jgi:hypothetical protein